MVAADSRTHAGFPDQSNLHEPKYAVWELTLACNLKCTFCGSRAGRKRKNELTTSECLEVVESLASIGVEHVTIIGGEAYLRKDWLRIIAAIKSAGMTCSMQTGGRGLNKQRLTDAVENGLTAIGVSLDGDCRLHDQLRGVPGSYLQAITLLENAVDMGLVTTVNTEVSRQTTGLLKPMLKELAETGITGWRIGLFVPMGRAADSDEFLVQPYQLLELFPLLAELTRDANRQNIDVQLANSLGYFGPYERLLRKREHSPHWKGCSAGKDVIGVESDGTIKACPSLPTGPYAGGNIRDRTLDSIWKDAPQLSFKRKSNAKLSGFCATCYYAPICGGGCSWQAHAITGAPGNNPLCHHRALNLQRQGLREKIRLTKPASGKPYDLGEFEIVVENMSTGEVTDQPAIDSTDSKPDAARYHSVLPCPKCNCHVYAGTSCCPHCGSDIGAILAKQAKLESEYLQAKSGLLKTLSEIKRCVSMKNEHKPRG